MSRESNICPARKSESYSKKTLQWTSAICAQSKSKRKDLVFHSRDIFRHVSLKIATTNQYQKHFKTAYEYLIKSKFLVIWSARHKARGRKVQTRNGIAKSVEDKYLCGYDYRDRRWLEWDLCGWKGIFSGGVRARISYGLYCGSVVMVSVLFDWCQ